jgi:hypothetical protein
MNTVKFQNAATALHNAQGRLATGIKYGPHMYSSRKLCVSDAIDLIRESEACDLPESVLVFVRCARAVLTQNHTFDADIKAATSNIGEALFVMSGLKGTK